MRGRRREGVDKWVTEVDERAGIRETGMRQKGWIIRLGSGGGIMYEG